MTTAPAPVRENLQPPARHSWFWTWRVVCVVMSGGLLLNLVGLPVIVNPGPHYNGYGWPSEYGSTEFTRPQWDQYDAWRSRPRHWERFLLVTPRPFPRPSELKNLRYGAAGQNALWILFHGTCVGLIAEYWQRRRHPSDVLRQWVLGTLCGLVCIQAVVTRTGFFWACYAWWRWMLMLERLFQIGLALSAFLALIVLLDNAPFNQPPVRRQTPGSSGEPPV